MEEKLQESKCDSDNTAKDATSKEDHRLHFAMYEALRNQQGGMCMCKIGGYWLPPAVAVNWLKIRNLEVRPDDIFLATFPKTGTNWLYYILYMMTTGNVDQPKGDYRMKLMEMPLPPNPQAFEMLAANPSPRRITTHLPATLLPERVLDGRLIYIYRDVKDVVVSYYHHYLAFQPIPEWEYNQPFEHFVRRFMAGEVVFGPYEDNLRSYLNLQKAGKPVLIIKYEDLMKNTKEEIRKVAVFIGKNFDEDTLQKIQEAASFDKMNSNSFFNWSRMKKAGIWKQDKSFLRKGVIGDWHSHFTDPKLLEEFNEYVKKNYPMEMFPDFE